MRQRKVVRQSQFHRPALDFVLLPDGRVERLHRQGEVREIALQHREADAGRPRA